MATTLSVNIDPTAVLGVRNDASLAEIRDAYRTKAKRYHPDAGGEEWAFRILVECYEQLSTARVSWASEREGTYQRRRPAPAPPPPPPPPSGEPARGFTSRHSPPPEASAKPAYGNGNGFETLHEGTVDASADPMLVVDVEKLTLRYQIEHIWLVTEHGSENRILSCSLNVAWPDPAHTVAPESIPGAETLLASLQAGFERIATETQADPTRSAVVEGRFSGWLSYPNNTRASQALEQLTGKLRTLGLSVRQRSRDLLLPRHTHGSPLRG